MIKRITKIDVQPMCDEIDNNLWEPTGGMVGHGRNWVMGIKPDPWIEVS